MIVSGELVEVQEVPEGSSVVGALSLGATEVPVANVDDFGEDGICTIADESYTYTLVDQYADLDDVDLERLIDDDPGTGTLVIDPPLVAAVEDGEPVLSCNAWGLPESQLVAYVQVYDDDPEPVPVDVAISDRGYLEVGHYQSGSLVELESTGLGYRLRPFGVEPVPLDGDVVAGTVTGATIRTAEDGQRVAVTVMNGVGALLLYTGHARESSTGPGFVAASATDLGGGDVVLQSSIVGPKLSPGPAAPTVSMSSMDIGGTRTTFVTVAADKLTLNGDRVESPNLYLTGPPTTGAAANVNIGPAGQLRESTSSRRFKQDIEDAAVDPAAVLRLRGRTWRDRSEVEDDPDTEIRYVGFIAEEVHDAGLTDLVVYDEEGPRGLSYERMAVPLLELARHQQERIEALEAQVQQLLAR